MNGSEREPVAAQNLDALRSLGPTSNVKNRELENFVIVTTARGPQLWANPSLSRAACTAAWDAAFSNTRDPSKFDVDHLYCQASANDYGYGYVRLVLTKSALNQEAGRGWEQQVQLANQANQVKPGIRIPRIRYADLEQRAKLATHSVGYKRDTWSGLRQFAVQEHKQNLVRKAEADIWIRQLKELEDQKSGRRLPLCYPRSQTTPAVRVVAGLLLLVELGTLIYDSVCAWKNSEKANSLMMSLNQLRDTEMAEGRVLIPVLKFTLRPQEVMYRQPENTDELNYQLLESFHRQVYFETVSVDMDDYVTQARLADETRLAASVAGKNVFPEYVKHMWPSDNDEICNSVFSLPGQLDYISRQAERACKRLRQLAVEQQEWRTRLREIYLP